MSEEATLDEFTEQQQDGSTGNEELREDGFLTLPRDWKVSTLDEVAKEGGLVDGDWIESADMDEDGEIQLVQLGHIGQGRFKGEPNRFITEEFAEKENCTVLSEGDLLISRMQEPILRSCLLPSFDRDSVMAVDIARLQETEDWNRQLLKYVLNSRPIWKQGIAWASGTTRKRISRKNMEKLRLPTPSLSEQRKIATVLYTVDRAIEKTERIVEQMDIVQKGLLRSLFGKEKRKRNPNIETKTERLGPKQFQVPVTWEITEISSIGEVITGDTPSTDDESNFGGTLPFVTPENLSQGKYVTESSRTISEAGRSEVKPIPKGSVMMGCIGNIGKLAIANREVATNQQINSVVIDGSEYSSEFLYYHLRVLSDFIKSQAGQTTIPIVNKSSFKSFDIFKPPIEEQKEIVDTLSIYDEGKQSNRECLTELKRLKRGLMQDLLSGKVRTTDTNIEVPDEVAQYG